MTRSPHGSPGPPLQPPSGRSGAAPPSSARCRSSPGPADSHAVVRGRPRIVEEPLDVEDDDVPELAGEGPVGDAAEGTVEVALAELLVGMPLDPADPLDEQAGGHVVVGGPDHDDLPAA